MIVSNKGGGAGTEAFVYGRGAAGDPHKVVFGTNNVWLMPLVTRVGYSLADLRPVASMAADEFILWTHTDAPFRNARELIDAARARGGAFRMGGSQARDTDHILTKLIERATGVSFTYVPFRSGGEVAVQLAGGHVDANTNNPAENVGQWRAGRVRPLCVFNPRRLTLTEKVHNGVGWSDIPTSTEAGIGPADFRMPRTVAAGAYHRRAGRLLDAVAGPRARHAGMAGLARKRQPGRAVADRNRVGRLHSRG